MSIAVKVIKWLKKKATREYETEVTYFFDSFQV